MALDGRVNQRHNSRELAHHLQRRGEDVGLLSSRTWSRKRDERRLRTRSSRNPEFKDLSDEQTARILRAAATIVGNCERRVERSRASTNINVELGVPAEGWSPPADVREELEKRAARNVPLRSRVREPAEASDRAEGIADRRSPTATSGAACRGTTTALAEAVGRTHSEAGGGPAGT